MTSSDEKDIVIGRSGNKWDGDIPYTKAGPHSALIQVALFRSNGRKGSIGKWTRRGGGHRRG